MHYLNRMFSSNLTDLLMTSVSMHAARLNYLEPEVYGKCFWLFDKQLKPKERLNRQVESQSLYSPSWVTDGANHHHVFGT